MMILFQRRIIYLPSVPPGTRNESLAEGERSPQLEALLGGFEWKEVEVQSSAPSRWLRRKVMLKGIELEWKGTPRKGSAELEKGAQREDKGKHTVIIYLQGTLLPGPSFSLPARVSLGLTSPPHKGNAGTPLLRLPLFHRLLQPTPTPTSTPSRLTLLAIAPRSYWLSTRSAPTQSTLLADYRSTLLHALARYPNARVVLYGHSLGGAAALLLLLEAEAEAEARSRVKGMILENPLPSIPFMVTALYPQKWLPYHWLGPAVWDRWDARGELKRRAVGSDSSTGEVKNGAWRLPPALWIRSGGDEIIPTSSSLGLAEGEEEDGVQRMWEDWKRIERAEFGEGEGEGEGRSKWITVEGALHDTAFQSKRWREEVRGFLKDVSR